jgi:hypothetical protein
MYQISVVKMYHIASVHCMSYYVMLIIVGNVTKHLFVDFVYEKGKNISITYTYSFKTFVTC